MDFEAIPLYNKKYHVGVTTLQLIVMEVARPRKLESDRNYQKNKERV